MKKTITWNKNDPEWARVTITWREATPLMMVLFWVWNQMEKDFPGSSKGNTKVDLSRGIQFTWDTDGLQRDREYPGYTQEEGVS
jgi:hypothetical protein